MPTNAIAVLSPASGSACRGVVRFTAAKGGVQVVADIEGLTAGQQHAFHIHEFGDCSAPDATSAGSHYNPEGHPHGLPSTATRHAGDMGNLKADAAGKVHFEMLLEGVSLTGPAAPIVGRALIVHAKPDDGGQPVGNAGGRIACGVIGVTKAPEKK
jgi:Cu-Zn family superoxide dismutase